MDYARSESESEYTHGELCGLVGPVLNLQPDEIAEIVVVAFTADGGLRMGGTVSRDQITDALVAAVMIDGISQGI